MPEDAYVDLQYKGIELGSRLCMQEFTDSQAYLQCPQPMPVGSAVVIQVTDELAIPVQVREVSEQVAGAARPPGMLVAAEALEGAARDWWSSHVSAGAAPEAVDPAVTAEVNAADTEEMPAMTQEAAESEEQTEVSAAAPEVEAAPEAEPAPKEKSKAKAEEKPAPKKKRRRRKKK